MATPIDRRGFLTAAGVVAGAGLLAGCAPRPSPDYPPQSGEWFEGSGPFPSGVGSADPTESSVLVWTRAHPGGDAGRGIELELDVSTTPEIDASLIATLGALATSLTDHCVTVDVTGLRPGTRYWYRWRQPGHTSRVGRTRTAPAPGSSETPLRIAAFSCQRWTHGWYTAHADLAALASDPGTDVDLVLSLGDYVYDTGFADRVYVPGREDPVQDARSLGDFRSKYRLYRSDPHLQAVHAAYPMICVFDNHDGLDEPGDPQAAGALQAFFEHLPVRAPEPGRTHRSLRWGDAAELFMTDQRSFRDPTLDEAGLLGTSTDQQPGILDPSRSMLGPDQLEWLLSGLTGSDARWKIIGSQLMFWPWRSLGRFPWQPRGTGTYLNMVQWDGYSAERFAILDRLEAQDVRDTLLLSGDSHVFSAAQVSPDWDDASRTPRIAEVGTGSITSSNADEQGLPTDDVTRPLLNAVNRNHLRYFESERHGYVVAELTPTATTFEMRSPRTVRAPNSPVDVLATLQVDRGTQRIRRVR